jgi:hypothetical protein
MGSFRGQGSGKDEIKKDYSGEREKNKDRGLLQSLRLFPLKKQPRKERVDPG